MALELEKFAKEKSSELMLRWDNNYPGKCSIGIYNFLASDDDDDVEEVWRTSAED